MLHDSCIIVNLCLKCTRTNSSMFTDFHSVSCFVMHVDGFSTMFMGSGRARRQAGEGPGGASEHTSHA